MTSRAVSIVIRNHNYGGFLRDALDSALAQTHDAVEVIVVDDGSTDNSRDILEEYGSRIRAILQSNQGEGAGINAGFAAASGDIVIFLDSDDVLAPDTAARVAALWDDGVARVYFRMWTMAEDGTLLNAVRPDYEVPQLSLGEQMRLFGQVVSYAQSSNAYARTALACILPLDACVWFRAPDTYLNALTAAQGETRLIQEPMGGYRLHQRNLTLRNFQSVARDDHVVRVHPALFDAVRRFVGDDEWARMGAAYPSYHWLNRQLSCRLNANHPFADDRPGRLFLETARVILKRPETSFGRRVLLLGGLTVATVLPRPVLLRMLPRILEIHRMFTNDAVLRRHNRGLPTPGAAHWRKRYGVPRCSRSISGTPSA